VPAQAALGDLVAAIDTLSAQTAADLPPAQALLEAQVLLVQADRLRALILARLADVDRRQLHDLDGSPSTASWVAEQHTSTSRSDVALARKLDRYPQVAVRIAEGGLSVADGVVVSRALSSLRRHLDRPDGLIDGQDGEAALRGVIGNGIPLLVGQALGGVADDDPRLLRVVDAAAEILGRPVSQLARIEAAFLLVAEKVEPGQLRAILLCLVDALLPNELAARADDAHTHRGLELIRDDDGGGWTVRGRLDLECGELLHTALHAAMDTDPDNPLDTAAAAQLREQGRDPYEDGCVEVRSRPQRRHDALKLLMRKALDTGVLGSRGKHSPHIAVAVLADTLHDQPGALPARAASGVNLPIDLVRRLLCDSALTRFVLSLGHRVIESSHTERTLKPHERRIKQIETGGTCQAAGCNRGTQSGHRLIPHHAEPYAVSRSTSLEDTVLLCEVSHYDLHEGGKTLRLKDGRRISPAGWADQQAA
jgi:hypothetical protein